MCIRDRYKAGDGEWTVFDPAEPPKFTEEQTVHTVVRVWDIAGNVSEEKARDIVLDLSLIHISQGYTPQEVAAAMRQAIQEAKKRHG